MRRLHRWFGLVTGIVMLLIASTGIAMQVIDLVSPDEHHGPPPSAAMAGPPPAVTGGPPPAATGGPPGGPPQGNDLRHLIDHIHDGEVLGNTGRIISLLMGVALLFFSISGIWMYWQMFQGRKRTGNAQLFW